MEYLCNIIKTIKKLFIKKYRLIEEKKDYINLSIKRFLFYVFFK